MTPHVEPLLPIVHHIVNYAAKCLLCQKTCYFYKLGDRKLWFCRRRTRKCASPGLGVRFMTPGATPAASG